MSFSAVSPKSFRTARIFALAVLLLPAALLLPPVPDAPGAIPPEAEIRAALERTLREHPEIILDILKNNSETVLEIAQQGNIIRKRKAAMAQWENDAAQRKTVALEGRPFRGKAGAPVTVVAYSDFTCPYCHQAEMTLGQLLKKYDGSIRMTFKALPKEDYAPSQAAAKYATAAFMTDQDKGWEFFDLLFKGSDQFEREGEAFLKATAARAGLDFKKLKADAGSGKVQERIEADRIEADTLGISGTPYFLVNDLVVRGAISKDLFEDAIEMALRLGRQSAK